MLHIADFWLEKKILDLPLETLQSGQRCVGGGDSWGDIEDGTGGLQLTRGCRIHGRIKAIALSATGWVPFLAFFLKNIFRERLAISFEDSGLVSVFVVEEIPYEKALRCIHR